MAFNRYWVATQAKNANDNHHVDMLERQGEYISRLEKNNQQLRLDINGRDETIREYWETIINTQARLQIIESAQTYLKTQNDILREQVSALTESNQQLISEITQLHASLGNSACHHSCYKGIK